MVGAPRASTALAFFRTFAGLFVIRLCGIGDAEERHDQREVPTRPAGWTDSPARAHP
jgi:hypothetical protein